MCKLFVNTRTGCVLLRISFSANHVDSVEVGVGSTLISFTLSPFSHIVTVCKKYISNHGKTLSVFHGNPIFENFQRARNCVFATPNALKFGELVDFPFFQVS